MLAMDQSLCRSTGVTYLMRRCTTRRLPTNKCGLDIIISPLFAININNVNN